MAGRKEIWISTMVILMIVLSACKKEVPFAEVGSTEVEIVFTSPVAGSTTMGSNEVSIEARIDANAMMSGYRITLVDIDSGEIIKTIDDIYEQTQYLVHYHWYPETTESRAVEIRIDALEQSLQVIGSNSIQINCEP